MLVSVLAPVLNEERHIREAVAAMCAQRLDGELELLLVDGRSDDRTRSILLELAQADARVRVLDNPARQTASGLNVGLRHARGEFVARMDGHTVYPPDYLAVGIERLRRGDVEWVCGPQIPHGDGTWSRRVALALRSRLGTGASNRFGGGGVEPPAEIELDTGVFTGVWSRETLDALGGWDEGWPVNQDSELAARVLAAGGRILSLRRMGAVYVPRDSPRALARQYWRYGYYRAKTSHRHPGSLRRSSLAPPAVLLVAVSALLAPRLPRRMARVALLPYALALAGAGVSTIAAGHRWDGAAVPAVLGTMHVAWGCGFLAGCVRFGPPIRALAGVAGWERAGRATGSARAS